MARLRGRALRGKRLIGHVPWGHWQTTRFLAGLRYDRLVAPLVLDGAINGAAFRAYVEQFLASTLGPNDIVVADKGSISDKRSPGDPAASPCRAEVKCYLSN